MADFLGVANIFEKLNSNNYENWSIRMRYYLIGQDLWDIVGGDNTTPPVSDAKALKEWEIKCEKAMFVLMAAVEDEQMQRIRSAKTPKEAWDMEALASLGDGELDSQASTTVEEEEDWDFEDPMMITEDEWDISMSSETWGEENGEIKLELEIEEETDEQCVKLPETQGDHDEDEGIKVSETEEDSPRITHSPSHAKVDQVMTRLRQLEKILESGEELEKSQARRSSKTQKQIARYVNIAIAEEGSFREVASNKESCQDIFPEELSITKLQKLQEQLNIRRRKSVSRGSIEQESPPT